MNANPFVNIFLVAGESSGDQLGAELMRALQSRLKGKARFSGVGGPLMEIENLHSLFPSSDIAIIGPAAIIRNFPVLLRRLRQTVDAVITRKPDILVVIDSPEFTQRVAKRVRKLFPELPIIKYVAPQVWGWRPKRAKKMRPYIDEILALLPFEPEAYARLEGPRTTYVGHPLIARRDYYELTYEDWNARKQKPPMIAVLPGSRSNEIKRLLPRFGEALEQLRETHDFQAVIPVVPHLRKKIEVEIKNWKVQPTLVEGAEAKWTLFRRAQVALTSSGTATLELALAQVPMVVTYKVEPLMELALHYLLTIHSISLPSLIVDKRTSPEFYQKDVCAEKLAPELARLLDDEMARQNQISDFTKLFQILKLPNNASPASVAAERVIANLPAYLRDTTGT